MGNTCSSEPADPAQEQPRPPTVPHWRRRSSVGKAASPDYSPIPNPLQRQKSTSHLDVGPGSRPASPRPTSENGKAASDNGGDSLANTWRSQQGQSETSVGEFSPGNTVTFQAGEMPDVESSPLQRTLSRRNSGIPTRDRLTVSETPTGFKPGSGPGMLPWQARRQSKRGSIVGVKSPEEEQLPSTGASPSAPSVGDVNEVAPPAPAADDTAAEKTNEIVEVESSPKE